jgi:class 3 adenylate cyclase
MTGQIRVGLARFAHWLALPLRLGLRVKITLPYILLAMLLAIGGAVVITQLVVDSVQERFVNQLLETGRLAADRVVEIEQESLATLRTVSHTDGVPQATLDGDAEAVRALVYPIAVNGRPDVLELLDRDGIAILSLRHQRGGLATAYEAVRSTDFYATLPFVRRVLSGEEDESGDKFAGLVTDAPWGAAFYVAGPVFLEDELVGVVLVGSYLDQLAADLRSESGAHQVTIYTSDGQPLATTFPVEVGGALSITPEWYTRVLDRQDEAMISAVQMGDQRYNQAFFPFEARHGSDLAVLSAALSQGYLVRTSPVSRLSLTLIVVATVLGVIGVGAVVARHITGPILAVARASRRVAQGDLSQRVQVATGDEVGDLAHAFNEMVDQLRLGETVRDMFGRAVSPEVSAALIEAVSSGQITLGGETRRVTVLFSDIKGFTMFSEQHTAGQVVAMFNEFFGAIYPAIGKYGGVINKFGGDSTMAIFGAPIPQPDHARRAVSTALAMRKAMVDLNARREARGQTPIHIGIGINTGEVVVGTVGAAERLEYTTIGDAVNVASRIEGLTRQFAPHDVLISQATLDELGPDHGLDIEYLGGVNVKGKTSQVHIYAVLGEAADA